MADRTVKVILRADASSLVNGMKQSSKATQDFATEAKTSAGKHKASWESTGQGMMVAGGVIAAGVGLAVKSFMDFDAAMSQVQAGTMASGKALDDLRAAAIDAGAKTQYSATEAAQAITAMGKAGVSTKDILGGGLTGALSLAAAGQLEVGRAAEIAATAMNQFGLKGKDIPHIADLLAAGAGKAMGSVEELAGALKYAGVVAAGAGWSIDETTGVLAEFAQAGIVGEQAGTSLRGVIMSMSAPSKIAAKEMENLGINMYDANGAFLKAAPLAQMLKDKLGPLDEATRNAALGQIFGNEQITAAQVLYEGGGAAVEDWTKKVNDVGFASEQAAMLTDNLKGDIERLGGSLSSVLIQSGSGANGMLRTMTQELQGAIDLYGSMPVPVQQTATAIGAVGAATLLTTGAMVTLVPKAIAANAALASMGRTGALLSRGMSGVGSALMGPLGIALAVGAVALGYYAHQAQESKARVDELAASLDQQTGALTESTAAGVTKKLSDGGLLDVARVMGIAEGDLTNAYLGNAQALARVNAAMETYKASVGKGRGPQDEMKRNVYVLTSAIHGGSAELDAAKEKTKQFAAEQAATIDPVTGLTGAQKARTAALKAAKEPTDAQVEADKELAKAAEDLKKKHDALTASITGYGSAMLAARGDARSYQAAIDAAAASLKENGRTLDITTEKGRSNASALDAIASSALKAAESSLTKSEADGTLARSSQVVTAEVGVARKAFIDSAVAMGANKAEAANLADQAGLTAGRVQGITNKLIDLGKQAPKPTVNANTAPAKGKIDTIQAQIDAIRQGKVPGVNADTAEGKRKIATLQQQIDDLHGKTVTVTYMNEYRGTVGLAEGTDNWRGGMTWVGERGPELAILPKGTAVIPNHKLGNIGNLAAGTDGALDRLNSMRFAATGNGGGRSASLEGSVVDMGGVRADLAEQTAILRTLVPGFGTALDRQARTVQTMQRQFD